MMARHGYKKPTTSLLRGALEGIKGLGSSLMLAGPPIPSKTNKPKIKKARFRDPATVSRMQLIAKMTNWQRNQWARAGYPQDTETITKYTQMVRHG